MASSKIISSINLPQEAGQFVDLINHFFTYFIKLLIVPLVLGGILGYTYYKKEKAKPIEYVAQITFVPSSTLSGGGALHSVSLPKAISSGGGENSFVKDILTSDAVISSALFKPISRSNNEMLVNYLIDKLYPNNESNIKFTHPSIDSLSLDQSQLYNRIKSSLVRPESSILSYSNTSISKLSIKTVDETLSYALVENLFSSLNEFYQTNTINSYDEQLSQLINTRDSLYSVLKNQQYLYSKKQTQSGFKRLPEESYSDNFINQEIQLNEQMYKNMYRRIEDYKLNDPHDAEIFRKLDKPILPLSKTAQNVSEQTIIGSLIGFSIGIFIIIISYFLIFIFKLYRKAARQNATEH